MRDEPGSFTDRTRARQLPNIRAAAFVVTAVALVTGSAGCGRQGKAAPQGGSTVPPSQTKLKRKVELARAEQRALDYVVETTGYLEAEGQTEIGAGVSGVVDEVLFREGQRVGPETILVKVDQRRYVSAADVARANEKRAEAAVEMAKDAVRRAARIGTAALSDEERTKASLMLKSAEADLASAHASRVLAEHNLDRSQVRAPYAGQINQRKVTAGTYLEDKTPIATMADLSRLRLVGWVPEKAMPMVRELIAASERVRAACLLGASLAGSVSALVGGALDAGDLIPGTFTLEFKLLAFPRHSFRARVFYLCTVADPDTHMFQCRAEVATHAPGALELRPGYTAQILVPVHGSPNACIIPEEAIRASERGFVVFVPERRTGKNGDAEWVARARTVERGLSTPKKPGEREVWVEVREGLRPGDWLVRRGSEALEDGTPLDPPPEQLRQLEAVSSQ
jgi:multidrug efflux system membrane fusion protein